MQESKYCRESQEKEKHSKEFLNMIYIFLQFSRFFFVCENVQLKFH